MKETKPTAMLCEPMEKGRGIGRAEQSVPQLANLREHSEATKKIK
jgi:hypothetical protein